MISKMHLTMGRWAMAAIVGTALLSACEPKAATVADGEIDRTSLPIRRPTVVAVTEPDARKATVPPPTWTLSAPKDAPNVVVVLIDDMGFGQPAAFGGPIAMPTLARIANEGVRYNRFHTTAVCSASRAALLSGHNAHANNMGEIAEVATAFPGNTFVRPEEITPLAQILRMNGFNTAMFGKSHETPGWETTSSGPFDRWPTGQGFEKFYGFLGGETNNWSPALFDGTNRVAESEDPRYHLTEDLADKAIEWVSAQQSLTPDRPFFIYFAPGGTHAPHHAPKEWADRYKGKFDAGWDRLREETFARQKAMGVIPADAQLTPRPNEIPAWDSFTPAEQRLFARQMEVFAGFAEHTDYQVGRLIDQIEQMGELDNTIIVYIAGDNGASAEGGPVGTYNEMAALNGVPGTTAQMLPLLDRWGGPETYPHYTMGWAWAGNTPFQWVKQIAGHLGGSRVGMAMRWPGRITARGEVRDQFHHLIDVAPTVLEATNIPQPRTVNGVVQRPMDGVSMLYSVNDSAAADRRVTQYFDVFGNRSIYHEGWMASTLHNVPWLFRQKLPAMDEDVWELYDLRTDYSQSRNVAAENPEKLKEMLAVFDREAIRNNVYPIDDRKAERVVTSVAGRPDILHGRTEMTFYPGMTQMPELSIVDVKNVAHTVTAEVELTRAGTQGVIFAQGGRFGGWSLFMKGGRLVYEQNFFGLARTQVVSSAAVGAGKHTFVFSFTPDTARKPGSPGLATLSIDGVKVAERRIERMVPGAYSFDDGSDVGVDLGTPVSLDYPAGNNAFTGRITRVTLKVQ